MIEKHCKICLTVIKTSNSRSQRHSVKKGLLKISQNSQKNTSARPDLLKNVPALVLSCGFLEN